MSLPNGLSTVTVACGPYSDSRGAPYTGTVTFTPSIPVVWAATGQAILHGAVNVPIDSTGSGTVTLPATDADGLAAAGNGSVLSYTVSYGLRGPQSQIAAPRAPFTVQLPKASPSVALESLQSFTGTGGVSVSVPVVQSVAGLTGTITADALQAILGGSSAGSIEGGGPGSVYGGTTAINGGTP